MERYCKLLVGAADHLEWYVYFKFHYIYDRVILINVKFWIAITCQTTIISNAISTEAEL